MIKKYWVHILSALVFFLVGQATTQNSARQGRIWTTKPTNVFVSKGDLWSNVQDGRLYQCYQVRPKVLWRQVNHNDRGSLTYIEQETTRPARLTERQQRVSKPNRVTPPNRKRPTKEGTEVDTPVVDENPDKKGPRKEIEKGGDSKGKKN